MSGCALVVAGAAAMLATIVGSRRRPAAGAAGVGIHPPPAWRPGDVPAIRVGTYNIRCGKGLDRRRDLERIAAVLDGVDVAGLYEVAGGALPGMRDQASRLGRACALGWLFIPTERRFGRERRGNALLSALPVGDWYQEPLADSSGTHYRKLTVARLMWRGAQVTVMTAHVSKRADQHVQLERIGERFLSCDRAILMGDFNATSAHPVIARLIARADVTDAIAASLGAADSGDRIDWLLVRGLTVRAGGSTPPGASDHPYYWADLDLGPLPERL